MNGWDTRVLGQGVQRMDSGLGMESDTRVWEHDIRNMVWGEWGMDFDTSVQGQGVKSIDGESVVDLG